MSFADWILHIDIKIKCWTSNKQVLFYNWCDREHCLEAGVDKSQHEWVSVTPWWKPNYRSLDLDLICTRNIFSHIRCLQLPKQCICIKLAKGAHVRTTIYWCCSGWYTCVFYNTAWVWGCEGSELVRCSADVFVVRKIAWLFWNNDCCNTTRFNRDCLYKCIYRSDGGNTRITVKAHFVADQVDTSVQVIWCLHWDLLCHLIKSENACVKRLHRSAIFRLIECEDVVTTILKRVDWHQLTIICPSLLVGYFIGLDQIVNEVARCWNIQSCIWTRVTNVHIESNGLFYYYSITV